MSLPQPLERRLAHLLDELETECAHAEVALRSRNWPKMRESLYDQRRTRQAIVNELAASSRALESIPEVATRLRAIFAFRADQLRRLAAYRNDVSEHLRTARKWKDASRAARRSIGPTPVIVSSVR
jgi:flagellin-specific chaperone FliS